MKSNLTWHTQTDGELAISPGKLFQYLHLHSAKTLHPISRINVTNATPLEAVLVPKEARRGWIPYAVQQ